MKERKKERKKEAKKKRMKERSIQYLYTAAEESRNLPLEEDMMALETYRKRDWEMRIIITAGVTAMS